MGAFWSSTAASAPKPLPVPVPVPLPAAKQPDPTIQRKLDNDRNSMLHQLPPDVKARIASALPPTSVMNRSLGSTCSGLQAMSYASTALEVSSRMFADEPRAKAYLARYHSLLSLKVTVKNVYVLPRLDLGALQISSMALRLEHLDLEGQSSLSALDCAVITGLTSLQSLRIRGFAVMVLDLSPSVTDVTLQRCTLTTKEVTGAGIKKFKMFDCTPPNQQLDLRCLPAVQELHTGECLGELQLSLPSALEVLRTAMRVAGEVLSQLTCLTVLKCQTQSQVVDLRACTKLHGVNIKGDRLTRLDVSNCTHLTYIVACVSQLNDLGVRGCTQLSECDLSGCALARQPFQPGTTWRLWNLKLCSSKRLTDVSDLPPSLRTLDLCYCSSLVAIPPLNLPHLHTLNVSSCERLTQLDVSGCPSLRKLERPGSYQLYAINGMDTCAAFNKVGVRKNQRCEYPSKPNSQYCGVHRNYM